MPPPFTDGSYLSIPQTIGCTSDEEIQVTLADQAAAITSIPSYISEVDNFFICAPKEARHVDLQLSCSFDTWYDRGACIGVQPAALALAVGVREDGIPPYTLPTLPTLPTHCFLRGTHSNAVLVGWCRLEETILMLERSGDGRPLYVTQTVGEPPKLFTHDSIDRLWMQQQRHSSVLTGNYSCCRMKHHVTTPDGTVVAIPCDKDRLRVVLEDRLSKRIDALGALARTNYPQRTFYERVGASFKDDKKPFFVYFSLHTQRQLILARNPQETAEELATWPQDANGLATPEAAEAYPKKYGFTLEDFVAQPLAPLCFLAAVEGNLPMLRYAHETRGLPLNVGNPFDMTPLLVAARFANAQTVRYLCTKLAEEDLNKTSKNMGLSALGDASKCGHPEIIELLLTAGADTAVRRKNGCTPLLEACANGHAECARKLLQAGADASATDNDGATAVALAEATQKGADKVKAVLREFSSPR